MNPMCQTSLLRHHRVSSHAWYIHDNFSLAHNNSIVDSVSQKVNKIRHLYELEDTLLHRRLESIMTVCNMQSVTKYHKALRRRESSPMRHAYQIICMADSDFSRRPYA